MKSHLMFFMACLLGLLTFDMETSFAGAVSFKNNQLFIDSKPQPQLFGAELQYFRLRGGYGPNVPREKVLATWHRALKSMRDAGMNAVGFYIPWDFHEYKEGHFDFAGTVDEDGDGQPDYPSRDVKTFLALLDSYGLKIIQVRPGPYINAEWGFLGFGAIPLWFHLKYPNSHMQNPQGLRTKVYDYLDEDLLRHTALWFKQVYNDVLKPYMGPGKPISFLQLDNETNFMWQSIYNHNYSDKNLVRYRNFLREKYISLEALNLAHQTNWIKWDSVMAPQRFGENAVADQDWHRFQDNQIFTYLKMIRAFWENLGVNEPQVLFTLAESYNATQNGLLPHLTFRSAPGETGMLSVNLYPKTYENNLKPLHNHPFKADLDVKTATAVGSHYLGNSTEWVFGPEIQAGWWRGIDVRAESRMQTYLTTVGHGMKAIFLYYYTEGYNWQAEWQHDQVIPFYDALKKLGSYEKIRPEDLPQPFWNSLQEIVDQKIIMGIDVKRAILETKNVAEILYFDSPLDKDANLRDHYADVQKLGKKYLEPYGDLLATSTEVNDPVCLYKDSDSHVPSFLFSIDSAEMNSTWAAGLLGLIQQTGVNPNIIIGDQLTKTDLAKCQIVFIQDNLSFNQRALDLMSQHLKDGAVYVSFFGGTLANRNGILLGLNEIHLKADPDVTFMNKTFSISKSPVFSYTQHDKCDPLIKVNGLDVATRCQLGQGYLIQIGASMHSKLNSDIYAFLGDMDGRRGVIDYVLAQKNITPSFKSAKGFDRVTAFARQNKSSGSFVSTFKSARQEVYNDTVKLNFVSPSISYTIHHVFENKRYESSGLELVNSGINLTLAKEGAEVVIISPR